MFGFGRKRVPKPVPEPAAVVRAMRERALSATAEQVGVAPSAALPNVWGVLMETGYAEALVTLLVFADGTTSLYFGNGGGIIGAGEHARVRQAGAVLLAEVERQYHQLTTAGDYPLPAVGHVRFYARTFATTRTAKAEEQALAQGRHPLSSLFSAGQSVITAIRECTETGTAG